MQLLNNDYLTVIPNDSFGYQTQQVQLHKHMHDIRSNAVHTLKKESANVRVSDFVQLKELCCKLNTRNETLRRGIVQSACIQSAYYISLEEVDARAFYMHAIANLSITLTRTGLDVATRNNMFSFDNIVS